MYLYKENNNWVFGTTTLDSVPAGTYTRKGNSATNVSFISHTPKYSDFTDIEITNIFKNANGDKYASVAEFKTATNDFFTNATQSLVTRVAELEEKQTFFLDYYRTETPETPLEEQIWYHTTEKKLYTYINGQWLNTPLSANSIYVDRNTNMQYAWSGVDLISMTAPLTKAGIEALVYSPKLAIPALNIDLSVADVFEKTLTGASSFTISNPILFKPFRVILTGGSLNATLFTGYTTTWLASTAQSDYVAGSVNYLYCEIREAGKIYCFWGE